MCHTWGLARSPAELQGGQGQGHDFAHPPPPPPATENSMSVLS